MNSNKNIPQLRFPEFTGEWEEKPLSNFLHEHKTKSDGKCEVHSVSVTKGVVNQVEYLGRSFAAADTSKYNLVKPNDIIYTKSPTGAFPYGIVKQNKNPYNVIVSPLYAVYSPVNKYVGYILDSYFESPERTNNYLSSLIQKGAKNTINISNDTFISKCMCLPSDPAEQQKIAECLSEIDNLIAAQGEKVDALKEKKKGMMQQMFPQKGETTPRLRFPGFTGEWEEKKLGEVCERLIDKVGGLTLVPISVSAGIGIISQKERFGKNISGKQYKNYIHITKGDYCYNKGNSKQFPQGCIYELKDFIEAAAPNAFISFRFYDNVCSHFFNGYFDQNYHGKQLAQYITSGARSDGLLNLNAEDFFKIKFMVPKTLAEQQKIAECLSSMDDMIASESAKLDVLKDHKKGLMQQLFPQPKK